MNKQDEDKAKEIALMTWGDFEESKKQSLNIGKYIQDACLDMAAWKEKKIIEKAIEYLEPIFKDIAGYNCGGELTNDFKKYMEEN